MDGHPPAPTNLRSVRFHVEMAAQAYTLGFPTSVRDIAVDKINLAAFQLNNVIVTVLENYRLTPEGYQSVEEPLYRTLEFLYSQADPEVVRYLLPVRAAIVRLAELALPWLLKQRAFVPKFEQFWKQEPMWGRWCADHYRFEQAGCLLPSWDDPADGTDDSKS